MVIPQSNPPTEARIELGRKLFYDPILSVNQKVSCATCHVPSLAFTDSISVSAGSGTESGSRNTPTLTNIGFSPYYLFEGGVKTLEEMVVVPLHSSSEMGLNMRESIARLNQSPEYKVLFKRAYGDEATTYTLTRALAAFQRSIISAGSRYDRFVNGDSTALNSKEKLGLRLFNSANLACSECHKPPLFTDFGFHNIGNQKVIQDKGRYRVTEIDIDLGKFKTPTLRNISLTSPYFHDGSVKSLEDVVNFYDQGGLNVPNQDVRVKKLNLSSHEKAALVAFLFTLQEEFTTK